MAEIRHLAPFAFLHGVGDDIQNGTETDIEELQPCFGPLWGEGYEMSMKVWMLGIALALLTFAPVASAAGGECNPGVPDFGCWYTYGDKTYDCTIWTGSGCVIDLSSIIHQ